MEHLALILFGLSGLLWKGGAADDESEGHHWFHSRCRAVDQHGCLLGLVYEVTQ